MLLTGAACALALGASAVPLVVGSTLVGLVLLGVLIAWVRHGREQVSVGALVRAPLYLLWKLPIYLKLVGRTETRWVRTDRS